MADNSLHEMTAAYALDALDEREHEAFERHLAECEQCRNELASLSETATALAYAVDAPPPPTQLRARILAEAGAGRENVVPLRQRRPFQAVAAVAAVAACAAIALGVWAATLQRSLDRERAARSAQAQATTILADPAARRIPLAGLRGALVLDRGRNAALVVQDLPRAPGGRTYEAWVIRQGVALRAALFPGGEGARSIVALERRVPSGAVVGVTIERAGGAPAPTGAPIARAQA